MTQRLFSYLSWNSWIERDVPHCANPTILLVVTGAKLLFYTIAFGEVLLRVAV